MNSKRNLYLAFMSGGHYFLISLSCVKIVKDGKEEEEFPVLDFSDLMKENTVAQVNRYLIVVELDGKDFGILVDSVLELCDIEEESVIKLGQPVINKDNNYLYAAVRTDLGENKQVLAYILDPSVLHTIIMNRL